MKEAALDALRVSICLLFMLYASWSDIKSREVSDTVWVFFAPIAFAVTSLQLVIYGSANSWIWYGLSFLVTSGLAMALFYSGAFGGADAKAFMCLALSLPLQPSSLLQPLFGSLLPIFPVTVLFNSILLAVLSVFYMLAKNVFWRLRTGKRIFEGFEGERGWRKFLTLLCGYKVSLSELQRKEHLFPLEDVRVEGDKVERRLILFPRDEEREEIVARIARVVGEEDAYVWATLGLPMLVFVTAGLVLALVFGDIVWFLLTAVLL